MSAWYSFYRLLHPISNQMTNNQLQPKASLTHQQKGKRKERKEKKTRNKQLEVAKKPSTNILWSEKGAKKPGQDGDCRKYH